MSLELRLMTVRVGLVTTFGVLPEVDWNVRWLCWRRMGGDGVGGASVVCEVGLARYTQWIRK